MRGNQILVFLSVLAAKASAFVPALTILRRGANFDRRMTTSMATVSTTEQSKRVAIVGGGPAGALMALYLSQGRGFDVDVFEAFDEGRIAGPTVRSWNIVLFERGCAALKAGGVDLNEDARELVVPLTGSVRHHAKKQNSKFFSGAQSICRGDMAKALLSKARNMPNINVHFGCSFKQLDMDKSIATFQRENGESVDVSYDMLVGADGVNSRVRAVLEEQVPDFTVRQREDDMAFKTILIPIMDMEGAQESWKSSFHVTNSKIGCIIAPPRHDGMLTATVVLPGKGPTSFEALMKTPQDVRDFFAKWYPTAFGPEGPSEEIAKDFFERRPQHLKSTYCSRLTHGNVVLIGDAAHSMWASLGQGVNAALEDCQVFAEVLDSAMGEKDGAGSLDIPTVLSAYNERRWEDAVAACALSEEGMGGGRSMRPAFAAQLFITVLLNKTLGRIAPKVFTPPSLMSISGKSMTYAAVLRGVQQEARVTKGLALASAVSVLAAIAKRVLLRSPIL